MGGTWALKMANIDGTEESDNITGTNNPDRIIGDVGDDTIEGRAGADVIFGDLVDPFDVPTGSTGDPNIGDPDTFSGTGFVDRTTTALGSKEWDLSDANAGISRNYRIVDDGNFAGSYLDFKYPGTASGDGTTQTAWIDLSTFEESFTIEVKSEDVDAEDNNPFDVDAAVQDVLVLTNVVSYTVSGNTLSVDYVGSNGNTYTLNVLYNGVRVEMYGPGGEVIEATFDDVIDGGGGADIIDGGLGNDQINASWGSDTIIASTGSDVIDGGDVVTDQASFDTRIIDTYDAQGEFAEAQGAPDGDIIQQMEVTVGTSGEDNNNLVNYGDGTVVKDTDGGTDGTDTFTSIERFLANEITIPDTPPSVNISITNSSFENPDLSGGSYQAGAPTGWTTTGSGGVYHVDGYVAGETGDNVYYTYGDGSISQTLSKAYNSDETYTFTVDIGDATYSGTQNYTVNLYAGSNLIGTTSGNTGSTPDTMNQVVVTSGAGNSSYNGEQLRIEIVDTGGGSEMFIDNVQGSYVNNNPLPPGEVEDIINLEGAVRPEDVVGLSDAAVGTFTLTRTGEVINFGGSGQPTINEILSGPLADAVGTWQVVDGDESGTIGDIEFEHFETINFQTICFVRGTLIDTESGPKPIEDLCKGDLVRTMDHGMQPVRWISSTKVPGTGGNAPICIRKGALKNERDLFVSPQHRMFLSGWQLELIVGEPEALVPAKFLVNDESIVKSERDYVEYFHMMFDDHEIVFAEGTPSESFHPGHVGVGTFSEETRSEIFRLFPQLETDLENYGPLARTTVKPHEASLLVSEILS